MPKPTLEELRNAAQKKLREAETAYYMYAGACDVGHERTKAMQTYDNVRDASRVY